MNNEQPQEILMKIIALGPSGAGKTSMLLRLTHNRFLTNYAATIGCDFFIKKIFVNDEPVRLQLWDSAGQERFGVIAKVYYRRAHGIFFTFDITVKNLFKRFRKFRKKLWRKSKI